MSAVRDTVIIAWAAATLASLGCARAGSVRWHFVGRDGPVTTFSLSSPYPSTTNFIDFIAPIDGKVYANSCFARMVDGDPSLAVDPTNRTITVSFSPPITNIACPALIAPVSGVDGRLGPLRPGSWILQVLQSAYTFSITDAPVALTIRSLAGASACELEWPISGDAFQLEWASRLPGAAWQALTNAPVTLSNRNLLRIGLAPGSRFFRLVGSGP